jgi:hypothetical protein
MNIEHIQSTVIYKYWKTLKRKNVANIITNKFLKKPYLENYIIELSTNLEDNNLSDNIFKLLESNKITNEELLLFINNTIDLDNDKKKAEIYFLNENNNDDNFTKLAHEIILYQVKYFRFYHTITELLFDSDIENNELYNFILIYIKNNKKDIKDYVKKNINFYIFNYYLVDLFSIFNNIINLLEKMQLFNNNNEVFSLFLKNLFTNWYNIYKQDILDNKVNDKIKDYVIKKNIISRILCLPNI